jgi:hypothetical protein
MVPIFLNLYQIIEGGGSNNLITMLVNFVTIISELFEGDLVEN